jgi:hypothetical protein
MTSRRRFFKGAASLAALSTTGSHAAVHGVMHPEGRAQAAWRMRTEAASRHRDEPRERPVSNGDETRFPDKVGVFSKTLPHNQLGEPDITAYDAMLAALESGLAADFEAIPMGGTGKLVNPQGAYAFEMEGVDPQQPVCIAPPPFDSASHAAETVELYWMALARDTTFRSYESSPVIAEAGGELSRLSGFQGPKVQGRVTAGTIFRGPTDGDLVGPYISQFLAKDVPYGTTPIVQRYRTAAAGIDYLIRYDEWLNAQNGRSPARTMAFDETSRYMRNGRDLASYVWKDFSYQAFLNAALILTGMGAAAMDEGNPYKASQRQAGFTTFGGPMMLDLVARVSNAALKAAWFQKWLVHRRIRPEETGGRLHNVLAGHASYPLHDDLKKSLAVQGVLARNSTGLLPQAYPEGAPAHPSFAAGHAAIAGAAATVLKALCAEKALVPDPVAAAEDGSKLERYEGPPLTIGGEIDKLASNIAIGRHFAGIHYWADAVESMRLGESVGLGILTDMVMTCPEEFDGFRLTKFDGTEVAIERV